MYRSIVPVLFLVLIALTTSASAEVNAPQAMDARIKIALFAAEPQIVTPTGIAVDDKGRVLAIESHTHFRPEGYSGPDTDRIRMFEDTNGDGRADKITTFFEGTTHTMNLAVCHDRSVYVATRSEIFRLRDTDNDGEADERTVVVRLETAGDYPHNGLSGFAFDFAAHFYSGLGENLGAPYKLIGSDGHSLSGGGEGGNIYRCRLDGSDLKRIATGFWNPFHLCLDPFGRLFAVDNDPDWRPPCRLLHIVPGGDYGYRYRLGRRGTHPFTSWFGELPGTLGMVAGTGEAPSGVLAYYSDELPADYRGDLLVTSWGLHAIERYRLEPAGASFRSTAETVIKGNRDFRPVGIALAPDGSLYVSDWVDRSYKLHGKGRIWRISAAKPNQQKRPTDAEAALQSLHVPLAESAARQLVRAGATERSFLRGQALEGKTPELRGLVLTALASVNDMDEALIKGALNDESPDVRALAVSILPATGFDPIYVAKREESKAVKAAALRRLLEADDSAFEFIVECLADDDAFLRQAAREALNRIGRIPLLGSLNNVNQRRETAILLRSRAGDSTDDDIARLLDDPNPQVRFIAAQWIGEANRKSFRQRLTDDLASSATDGQLFEAYLASLELLDRDSGTSSFEAQRHKILSDLLAREDASAAILERALRTISNGASGPGDNEIDHAGVAKHVTGLLQRPHPRVQVEAVRTLRALSSDNQAAFRNLLKSQGNMPDEVRAEAIASLAAEDPQSRAVLLDLVRAGRPALRHEALRTLQGATLSEAERQRLKTVSGEYSDAAKLVSRVLDPQWKPAGRQAVDEIDRWQNWLREGDAETGERVFFHPRGPKCFACHRINGRGSDFGPDLSNAGQLTTQRLLESILEPSRDIAPRFVPWTIAKSDGKVFTGILVSEQGEHEIYADAEGKLIRVEHSEIEQRVPQSKSIMPDGLFDRLTDQEVFDLIAFLRRSGFTKPTREE